MGERSECYNKALKFLLKREYSYLELSEKLSRSGFSCTEITKALNELIAQKYQSDTRFAVEFVQMRFNQGKGKMMIQAQLKQHSITDFDFSNYDFFELCKRIRLKKYGNQKIQNAKQKAQQMRFLQSRGFGFDEIRYAIE